MRERKTIRVPEWAAKRLKVGSNVGRHHDGYLVEKIGASFIDKSGRQMVKVMVAEPTKR